MARGQWRYEGKAGESQGTVSYSILRLHLKHEDAQFLSIIHVDHVAEIVCNVKAKTLGACSAWGSGILVRVIIGNTRPPPTSPTQTCHVGPNFLSRDSLMFCAAFSKLSEAINLSTPAVIISVASCAISVGMSSLCAIVSKGEGGEKPEPRRGGVMWDRSLADIQLTQQFAKHEALVGERRGVEPRDNPMHLTVTRCFCNTFLNSTAIPVGTAHTQRRRMSVWCLTIDVRIPQSLVNKVPAIVARSQGFAPRYTSMQPCSSVARKEKSRV